MKNNDSEVMTFITRKTGDYGEDCLVFRRIHKQSSRPSGKTEEVSKYVYQGKIVAASFTYSQLEKALTRYTYEKTNGQRTVLPRALHELFDLLGSPQERMRFVQEFYQKFEKPFSHKSYPPEPHH